MDVGADLFKVQNGRRLAALDAPAGKERRPSLEQTFGDIYVSRDLAGNVGANVSSNQFAANMNIVFAPGVTAIGIDLMQWGGNNGGWTIDVYDTSDVLLGSFATNAGSFVGITSTDAIGRMFLDKPDSGAVIDNLRFGAAAVPEPATLLLFGGGVPPASRDCDDVASASRACAPAWRNGGR